MILSDKFVCEDRERSTYFKHVAAPIFRKSFTVPEHIKRAEISICGIGFYDLFVNGRKITKGYLAPYISNPDHITYYDLYDIKPYLQNGENVIGIILGDGFGNSKTCVWDFDKNVFNASPKLAFFAEIESFDKTEYYDASDFKCKKGAITFNDLRSGVFYDSRLEEKGWNEAGFIEDDKWHSPVLADRPRGKAKICEAEPIRVIKEIKAVRIYKGELATYSPREDVCSWLEGKETQETPPTRTGGYVYDFGENNAGIFRLKIRGRAGQRIDIQCTEYLDGDKPDYGNFNFYPDGYVQRDIYILHSDEEEIFEPMFTYQGFRYIYISGITEEQADDDLLTYLVMSSDLEKTGGFECSDDIANKIFEIARRSDRANFYYFPTDCPHREKNGWTGDASVSSEHMIMTMNTEKSWREWLNNIRLAQHPDGSIPGIVPTDTWGYEWGNGPIWDSVLFNLPYMLYKYRGNMDIVKENAHAMMSYLEYICRQRDEEGIIEIGLGDLGPVCRNSDDYIVPLGFTDSVCVLDTCRKSEKMFRAAGLNHNADFAKNLGDELYFAVRKKYLNTDTMTIKSRCQTAQAMGIYFDIFTAAEKQYAFGQLMKILKSDNYKLTCGLLGTRVIFHVLARFGEAETAYKMITDEEFPSYGYYVKQGATTLPEHFVLGDMSREKSYNHHFLGDVIQWFIRYVGGINVKSSKNVLIRPMFIEGLNFARAYHNLPSGKVSVEWQRNGDSIELKVKCPPETECEIELPDGYHFEDNGYNYSDQDITAVRTIKKLCLEEERK